jgi:hypothetical protein
VTGEVALQVVPDPQIQLLELWRRFEFDDVPRVRRIDLVDRLNPSRAGAQQDDAISKKDALFEIVRDETDRRLGCLPQINEDLLQEKAGLRIQRSKGFIHQHDFRVAN